MQSSLQPLFPQKIIHPSGVIYIPPHLTIVHTLDKGFAVLARQPIPARETVCELFFDGVRPIQIGSPRAVQISETLCLNNNLGTIDDLFNHSCEPTVRINFSRYEFQTARPVNAGEEITYHYCTTEYDLVDQNLDFECRCDTIACLGRIRGFKYLTTQQKKAMRPHLSPFLKTIE